MSRKSRSMACFTWWPRKRRRSARIRCRPAAPSSRRYLARSIKLLAACVALGISAGAAGQYPERPLRLVVPQAPGSATDTVARILAPEMARPLGQPVVVENRPGGALTIGIDVV